MTLNISTNQEHDSQWVGGVEFVSSTPVKASDHIIAMAAGMTEGEGTHVHLANAYTVALADKSENYSDVLAAPAVNFPDGKPIGWVSALRRQSPRLRQVRGPQLFLDVFDKGRASGIRHYVLGSTDEVLAKLKGNLHAQYPGIDIVGVESPPFRKLSAGELSEQDERIRESKADIVWVGLGTPKQDVEAQRIAGSLPVVAVAIGAAIDFAAGTTPVAPAWMTNAGLEWVYRFASEPKRLWKRYVFGNVRFLKAALLAPAR